jgi:hypothetical protein
MCEVFPLTSDITDVSTEFTCYILSCRHPDQMRHCCHVCDTATGRDFHFHLELLQQRAAATTPRSLLVIFMTHHQSSLRYH